MILLDRFRKLKAALMGISITVIGGILVTMFNNFYGSSPQTIVKNTIIFDNTTVNDNSMANDHLNKTSKVKVENIKTEKPIEQSNSCSEGLDNPIDCPL
jgi:hypothetical protein